MFLIGVSACVQAGTSISVQNLISVKNIHQLHSRHLASYSDTGGVVQVQVKEGDRDIRNQSTHRGASGRDN